MPQPEKTKEDRLKETLTILKQLLNLGISSDDSSYLLVKEQFDEWIKTGNSWSGSIQFPRHGRRADIILPKRITKAATLNFKVV
jgi:hypothetical protein